MTISLVICCKDEERSLASVINGAKKYAKEIIVIDGHSTDTSRTIAKQYGVKVFIDNGKGKGAGMQLGIRKATGDIIVFMDADGSHKASDIPKLIAPIKHNRADLVIASRITGGSDDFHGNLEDTIRMIGSALLTQCINWRFRTHLTESQNGFRAIKSSLIKKLVLKENCFTIEQEILIQALHHQYQIKEISSHEQKRLWGYSKVNIWKMIWYSPLHLLKQLLYEER